MVGEIGSIAEDSLADLNPVIASSQLLLALKKGKSYVELSDYLARLSPLILEESLETDNAKKTFWINIYNAEFLKLRKYLKLEKSNIYKVAVIVIAGQHMTLDEIEHGILRRFKIKLILGYVTNIFAPRWIKAWALKKDDFRIHFALNCGAVSCPPIAFYSETNINEQLDMATTSFIENGTNIDYTTKTLIISKLFLWYKGDFGGEKGAKVIISEYLNNDFTDFKIKYSDYDSTEYLDNFVGRED